MTDNNATVQYAGNDFFVAITPSGHAQTLDVSPTRSAASGPLELLLIALGGCTGADVISVLRKKREQVSDYRVEVRGQRREEHPRSFRHIEVKHILRGRGISEKNVAKAIELSETKYCSVAATLRPTAEIVSTFEIHEDDDSAQQNLAGG
jgi:putative redox protein